MSQPEPDHTDLRGDPPIIDDPDLLEGLASGRLGNAVYVHARQELADGRIVAYLGVAIPTNTAEAARRPELTFRNYAPVGAIYADPVTIDGDRYYEVDLLDRDVLDAAIQARKRHENNHRATVLPPLRNVLEDWQGDHLEHADGDRFHRGVALGFELARRHLMQRWRAPYRGTRRWNAATRAGVSKSD